MRARIVFVAACATVLAACSNSRSAPSIPDPRIRIVSLAPSITEIAYFIHCERQLVGDTTFDDFPPSAKKLPHVADLSHVDLEALAKLRPSVVLALHDQEKEGSEIAQRLHVPVTYLPNRGIDDLYADIEGVGTACAAQRYASGLASMLRSEIAALAAKGARERTKPRVLFLLGLPGFTAGKGSYLDDLIRLSGGINVASDVDQPYPDLSGEAVVAMQPDVIVVGREVPFGQDVRSREPWRSLAAVRSGRVEVSPDDDLLERPGPRIVEGLAWLEKAIHKT